MFLRCSLWRQAAENAADGLGRGMRVIAQGRLQQRSFETADGEKRTVVELKVDELGPSLRYASVTVTRMTRAGEHAGADGGSGGGGADRWEREPASAG